MVNGCRENNPRAQEQLYKKFYGYAMSICLRYAPTEQEAVEVLNDAFLKVFTKLDQYRPGRSFKAWLRSVVVNTAIDAYRKSKQQPVTADLAHIAEPSTNPSVAHQHDQEYLLRLVQLLSPQYRMVFNLSVLEGYPHKEIAQMLHITESTSRSHLATANAKLRAMLQVRLAATGS